MPHWDWHTRADVKFPSLLAKPRQSVENIKIFNRVVGNFVAIHLPSAISITSFAYVSWSEKVPVLSVQVSIFAFSLLMFIAAVNITIRSYKYRDMTSSVLARSPAWWHEIVETEVKTALRVGANPRPLPPSTPK